ncbi:MAG: hypothetical protein HN719_08870 [Alphaproteobacteria bacterium]|jgi:hypothetical protein|nr:hypothetical protein [Alphaproteobacteria bacterium]
MQTTARQIEPIATSFWAEWRRLRHHILAALEHAGGTHSEDDVLDLLRAGQAQFWPAANSAMVTEIVGYPQGSHCRIWLAGGEYDELRALERDMVIPWASSMGCRRIELVGRKGWARRLTDYNEVARVLAKEI